MGGNGRIRSLTRIVTRSVMVEPQVLLLHEENTVRLSPFLQHRGAGDSIMHVGQAKVLPSVQHHAAPWLGLISGPPLQMACPSSWGIGAPTRPVRLELGTRQTSVPEAGSSPMTPLRLGRRHRAHRPLLASHLDGGSACSSRTTTTLSVVGVNGLVQMRGILLTIDSKSPSEVIKTKSSTFSRSSVWLPVSAGVAVRRGGRLRCCRGPAGRGSHPRRRRTEPVEPARPAGAEVRTSAAAAAAAASCRGGRAPAGARLLGCRVPDAASERWGAVPAVCPLPLCERGHSRAAGRDGAPRIPERGQAGRGEAPSPPHLPGPKEAAPSLDLALRRVEGGGGGRHGTRAGGPSWGSPECLDAEPPVLAFSLSLALSRRRGRRGAPAEGASAREEGQGHGPSLRDPRSSLYA